MFVVVVPTSRCMAVSCFFLVVPAFAHVRLSDMLFGACPRLLLFGLTSFAFVAPAPIRILQVGPPQLLWAFFRLRVGTKWSFY